jgi:hypothetical protein
MRYRLSTLVIWTAIGPLLLYLAYLYAGLVALSVHGVVNAVVALAVLYVPMFVCVSFRRWLQR